KSLQVTALLGRARREDHGQQRGSDQRDDDLLDADIGSWWLRRDPYCDERVKREESADEDFGGSARCESDVDAGATAEASDGSARMDRAFLALPDLECVVVCEADEFVPRLEHAECSLLGLLHRGTYLML